MNMITKTPLRTLLGAAALAAMTIGLTPAAALAGATTLPAGQQPAAMPADLAGTADQSQSTPVPCNGVVRCNSIIAYCAANSGTWTEQAHNTQGQPTKGRCDLR